MARRHRGWGGGGRGGESHFTAELAAAQSAGLSRVARQRLVYSALEDELRTDVHALALKTVTPEEDAAG
ncbi:MAG: BolA family transcriptional regulator [Rhodospirillaceae bacterium]|nr:BolA family transcriptional regulator [Rhodospirillaceae bacterium]